MPSFQLIALWESPCWCKNTIFKFYFIFYFLFFLLLLNYVFLWQAACNKVLKDTISNWFFAKLSVICRNITGSSLELVPFYTWTIQRSGLSSLTNKTTHSSENGQVQGLDWQCYKAANVLRESSKDLQKAWRTLNQDDLKRLQESLAAWKKI